MCIRDRTFPDGRIWRGRLVNTYSIHPVQSPQDSLDWVSRMEGGPQQGHVVGLFQTVDALVQFFEPSIGRETTLPRTVLGDLYWLRWFEMRRRFNL
eukprot:4339641-Alexandrium_andersonii.AAC.1